eukprot:scaffold49931_cov86-Phaeocystis_antarctica.AAC.1
MKHSSRRTRSNCNWRRPAWYSDAHSTQTPCRATRPVPSAYGDPALSCANPAPWWLRHGLELPASLSPPVPGEAAKGTAHAVHAACRIVPRVHQSRGRPWRHAFRRHGHQRGHVRRDVGELQLGPCQFAEVYGVDRAVGREQEQEQLHGLFASAKRHDFGPGLALAKGRNRLQQTVTPLQKGDELAQRRGFKRE